MKISSKDSWTKLSEAISEAIVEEVPGGIPRDKLAELFEVALEQFLKNSLKKKSAGICEGMADKGTGEIHD